MSLRMQIYNELVNKHSGIRERYMEVHCKQTPFSKINSYFVLLWLNVRYYILKDWTLDYIKIVRENEQKNLKTDVPESLFTTEYSATHILEAVKDYDIISFDIFDTLIFRPFSAPTDLFDYLAEEIGILDFKSVRIVQEWKARQDKFAVSGSYEVTLEEIWNRIECETGYPAGKGRNLEEELEQRFCYANPVMQTVFKELQRRKKTIIITSDMYLSEDFLEKLLAQNGYSGIQKLYISSEYTAGKSDGTIYEYVKEDFEKEKIIHIGDNEISDITNAKKAGLAVFYYPNVNKHSKAYRAYDMSLMVGAAYRGIVNNHMYCGNNSYSMEYEYGYIDGGLFVLGYCTFIHDYYKKNGIDKILFLSRDGDIIKQVYNKLYQEDSTEYAYWSRKAATKLMAEDDRHDYFRRFIEHKVNQQYKIAEILEAMELQELGRELVGLDVSEYLTDSNQSKLRKFIESKWECVIKKYKEQHKAAKRYYEDILTGCKRAVAVDIGWAGSGAMTLRHLVEQEWYIPCEIIGLIAGTNTVHNSEPDASEPFLQSGKLVAYLYSQSHNRDLLKKHDPNKDYNVFWELLLSSPTPQFSGFQSGNACREKTEDRYLPDLDITLQFGKYDANQEGIKEIQQGILDFAADYKEHFKDFPYMFNISGRDAYAPMLVAASHNEKYLKAIEKKFDLEINVN